LHMLEPAAVEFVEHMHVMQVGSFKVLFCAEADAMDPDGNPVEVKSSKPGSWGTETMFQMLSSGSLTLCHGLRDGKYLQKVNLWRLSEVVRKSLAMQNRVALEANLLSGMQALKVHFDRVGDDGKVYQISFDTDRQMQLKLACPKSPPLLPSSSIVKTLL
jgi:hypothetical protein